MPRPSWRKTRRAKSRCRRPTIQENCLDENDTFTFTLRGKQPVFVIEMTNKCEQRISCKVFVYINSAKGPVKGRGSIVMAAKSKGAAAKASFTMKAKLNSGSSQSTRECKAILDLAN